MKSVDEKMNDCYNISILRVNLKIEYERFNTIIKGPARDLFFWPKYISYRKNSHAS